jgi:hypothetical protein
MAYLNNQTMSLGVAFFDLAGWSRVLCRRVTPCCCCHHQARLLKS